MVIIMSDRLKSMKNYIEKKFNGYKNEKMDQNSLNSFDNMVLGYIRNNQSVLMNTKEEPYTDDYQVERDPIVKKFYDSKQKIDKKSDELIAKFNQALMKQSIKDRSEARS